MPGGEMRFTACRTALSLLTGNAPEFNWQLIGAPHAVDLEMNPKVLGLPQRRHSEF